MTLRRSLLGGLVGAATMLIVVTGCGTTESTTTAPAATPGSAPAPTPAPPGTATPARQSTPGYASGKQAISLDVNGTPRTALLVVPTDLSQPAPLVFAFHGHGGTGKNFDKKMNVEGLWPQAIVVYADGLIGHKGKTDPDGTKSGWQTLPGESGDEDLAFYDTLLSTIQAKLPVDTDRIYAMGHSNGSGFVSLLLNRRPDAITATANMSGQPGKDLETDPVRSMFMSMGRTDPIVPYANQVKSVPLAEQKIGADPSKAVVDGLLKTERGRGNLELDVYDYPGGHEPPDAVAPLIVSFFQRHTLSGG
jgi:polyhydroxybutyrate depolymerase